MELDVKKFRRAMMVSGYNVAALARAAGVSSATINLYLNHGVKPRLDSLGKLAKALGVDGFELVKEG